MAILDHRCRCGHRRENHVPTHARSGDGPCGNPGCDCSQPQFDAKPEIVTTFGLVTGPNTDLTEPGTVWNAGTVHAYELCGCDACHAAYRQYLGDPDPHSQPDPAEADDRDPADDIPAF